MADSGNNNPTTSKDFSTPAVDFVSIIKKVSFCEKPEMYRQEAVGNMKPVPVMLTPQRIHGMMPRTQQYIARNHTAAQAVRAAADLYYALYVDVRYTPLQVCVISSDDSAEEQVTFVKALKAKDCWIQFPHEVVRVHAKARKAVFTPAMAGCPVPLDQLLTQRITRLVNPEGKVLTLIDEWTTG
ncbi:MAG: hypothetical protein GY770_28860, partial [Aestuariibacter sp.]|nr:hypothetical protein [Aestuariibacter sp.]